MARTITDRARNETMARTVRECHAGLADSLCSVLRQEQNDGEIDPDLDPRQQISMFTKQGAVHYKTHAQYNESRATKFPQCRPFAMLAVAIYSLAN